MTSGLDELRSPRRRLPDRRLPSLLDSKLVPLTSGRREASVLLFLHGADCAECRSYVAELADSEPEFREWDGRVLLLIDAAQAVESYRNRAETLPFPVLRGDD